jgi:hypothetical protein
MIYQPTKSKQKYRLVAGRPEEVEAQVNKLIEDNWQFHGPLATSKCGQVVQPMIKYEHETGWALTPTAPFQITSTATYNIPQNQGTGISTSYNPRETTGEKFNPYRHTCGKDGDPGAVAPLDGKCKACQVGQV